MSLFQSFKSTLRAALAPAQTDYLRRNRRRANDALKSAEHDTIRAFAATMSRLPLHIVAMLKDELHPTGLFDYPRARIAMGVASPMEYYRLRSCAKEPDTISWIESQVRAGDVFYDVGANVGAYSLVVDAVGAGQVKAIAIEPSFTTFAQLNHNVFLNHASNRITPLCLALSSATGTATFQYSDLSSGSAMHALEERPDTRSASQAVLTVTMDDLVDQFGLPAPTLLKVNVDGAETAALLGAERMLGRPELRSILIELNESLPETSTLIDRLQRFGFVENTRHRRHDSPYYNYIFSRVGRTSDYV